MGSAKRSASYPILEIDSKYRRPANADENVPEASVSSIVRKSVQQEEPAPAVKSNRWACIQRRAYELAQQRGFTPGAELSDWLQAEREIDGATQQSAPEDQFTG